MKQGSDDRLGAMPASRDGLETMMLSADGRFYRQLLNSLVQRPEETGVIGMALLPWFSSFVVESLRYFQVNEMVGPDFELEHAKEITLMRHSIKWMDQPKTAAQDWIARFDEVAARQRAEFTGNTPHLWARGLETDLGLFSFKKTVFATTHSLSFALGIGDFDEAGSYMRDVSTAVAAHISGVTQHVESDARTFIDDLPNLRSSDVKSWNYYKAFGQPYGTIGYLRSLWAALGLIELLGAETPHHLAFPTHKLRHVVVHQVLETLRILVTGDRYPELEMIGLADIVDASETRSPLLGSKEARYMRNALVHYSLNPQADISKADVDDPLFGLPAIHGLSVSSSDFIKLTAKELTALRNDIGESLDGAARGRSALSEQNG